MKHMLSNSSIGIFFHDESNGLSAWNVFAVVFEPAFPQQQLELLRGQLLASIARRYDDVRIQILSTKEKML